MLPFPAAERSPMLCDMPAALRLKSGVYNSSTLKHKILPIEYGSSIPLNLHARFPILVRFQEFDEADDERRTVPFASIFKTNDDMRQDEMIIRFIETLLAIFCEVCIDCFLYQLHLFAIERYRGVMEVIQNSKSRHDIGIASNQHLLEFIISMYDKEDDTDDDDDDLESGDKLKNGKMSDRPDDQ